MQLCGMTTVVSMSKRGTITLPPGMRKKLCLDRMENPLLIIQEENGRIVLEPATAVPLRDLPADRIHTWIAEDEQALNTFLGDKV